MSARTAARARRTTAAALLFALATATLAACGDDTSDDAPTAARTAANGDVHNGADVEFASQMIQHHADALVMVDLTQGRDLSPEVAGLAEDVRAAQAPEIETMVDWLTAWGEDVPATSRDHVNSHMGSHGSDGEDEGEGSGMEGMEGMENMGMDPADLAALEEAEGSAFESMWLEMMVEHHEGAVAMAEAQQEEGLFPDAVALAESIEAGQGAEIEQMEQLLGQ